MQVFGEGVETVGRETVRVSTLDKVCQETVGLGKSAWLKIDAQGFEDLVLQGATETLKTVQVIEIELMGVQAYEGAPSMGQLVSELTRLGFELFSMDHIEYHNRLGRLAQVDALFVRPSFDMGKICPK